MSTRRSFLKTATLGTAAFSSTALSAMIVPVARPNNTRPGRDRAFAGQRVPDWVEEARAQIPASNDPFFQTAGIAPSPTPVLESVSKMLHYQNQGPVSPDIYPVVAATEPDLRAHLGRMFGATADEMALTHSTSEGINIASWSRNWESGDEVIISNQEHPANTIPWYNLATRFGIVVRRIDLSTGTNLMDEVRGASTARTRMVSISHVSRNNGRRITDAESAELADWLRARTIRFHLDGAQGPGCVPVNFARLGCDYYSMCGHKWLLGPKGTGAFFCREDMLEQTQLTWTGAHSTTTYDAIGNYELIPETRRFEFGTRALATFKGFDAALSWMESVGMDRILGRVDELVNFAAGNWKGRGFDVSSPELAGSRSGVFVLQLPPDKTGLGVYNYLRENKSTYTSPVDDIHNLRVAIHFFNTREEITATFDAIEEMGQDR